MKFFKQRDITDCGAACLRFVGAHYRRDVPVARLRQLAGTNQRGSTALGLVEAARQLGFTAKGVKGPAEALPTVPLPAIAHCLIDQKLLHYVVLVEWTPKFARVMDPAVGRVEKWSHEKFKTVWTGVLILVAPGEEFRPGDSTVSPWRRLWGLLAPHRSVLVQAFVGAVVTTILGLAMSVYVQKIVDHVVPDGNRSLLNLLGVAMLVVLAFKLVLGVFQSLLSMRTAQQIDASLILSTCGAKGASSSVSTTSSITASPACAATSPSCRSRRTFSPARSSKIWRPATTRQTWRKSSASAATWAPSSSSKNSRKVF